MKQPPSTGNNRRKTGHPTRYLVLDLDTSSAVLVPSEQDGRASLTATWALPEKINLWTAWVECIQALLGEDYPFDVASGCNVSCRSQPSFTGY